MKERILTLGHSPDPDDAFMHYALAAEQIPLQGYRFVHVLRDIQTLNEMAQRGELDITAISIHAYPYVADQYALLPNGASMGDGYGPRVIAREPLDREALRQKTIAVPGTMTSAFLALQLWLDRPAEALSYIVVPFDQIFDVVQRGEAEAGLVIHEGQLTWEEAGFVLCADLGQWWQQTHDGLPLPLGANVIHKRIPPEERRQIARLLRQSIEYALANREEALAYALQFGRGLNRALGDRFIEMYVNHWTLDYGSQGREAIRRFLTEAYNHGLLPQPPEIEFVTYPEDTP